MSMRFAFNAGQISESDFNSLQGNLNGDQVQVEVIGARKASTINNPDNIVNI